MSATVLLRIPEPKAHRIAELCQLIRRHPWAFRPGVRDLADLVVEALDDSGWVEWKGRSDEEAEA